MTRRDTAAAAPLNGTLGQMPVTQQPPQWPSQLEQSNPMKGIPSNTMGPGRESQSRVRKTLAVTAHFASVAAEHAAQDKQVVLSEAQPAHVLGSTEARQRH